MVFPGLTLGLSRISFFCQSGHPVVTVDQFLTFVDPFLHQEAVIVLPRITGQDLRAKRSTAGGLGGWAWNEVKALLLPWLSGLAILLNMVELTGNWPQGLLDAYVAKIPKVDGDSTPLGQCPLSEMLVVVGIPQTFLRSGFRVGFLSRCSVCLHLSLLLCCAGY